MSNSEILTDLLLHLAEYLSVCNNLPADGVIYWHFPVPAKLETFSDSYEGRLLNLSWSCPLRPIDRLTGNDHASADFRVSLRTPSFSLILPRFLILAQYFIREIPHQVQPKTHAGHCVHQCKNWPFWWILLLILCEYLFYCRLPFLELLLRI